MRSRHEIIEQLYKQDSNLDHEQDRAEFGRCIELAKVEALLDIRDILADIAARTSGLAYTPRSHF